MNQIEIGGEFFYDYAKSYIDNKKCEKLSAILSVVLNQSKIVFSDLSYVLKIAQYEALETQKQAIIHDPIIPLRKDGVVIPVNTNH